MSNFAFMKASIDRIGTLGILLTAFLSPCCFPLFGFLLAGLGIGTAELFGGWTMYIFETFVVLSLIGSFFAYRKNQKIFPLTLSIISSALIIYSYHFMEDHSFIYFLYAGMTGIFLATFLNYSLDRKIKGKSLFSLKFTKRNIQLKSTITCPNCRLKSKEDMPINSCQYFYQCKNCKEILKPKKGDCCVYCSYGSVKCPPVQSGADCC